MSMDPDKGGAGDDGGTGGNAPASGDARDVPGAEPAEPGVPGAVGDSNPGEREDASREPSVEPLREDGKDIGGGGQDTGDDGGCKVQTEEEINFQQQRENLTWAAAEEYLETYKDVQDEDITNTEQEMYARQALLKGWDQKVLKNSKVLVVGVGVVGRELAKDLALIGVGSITLVDGKKIKGLVKPRFLMPATDAEVSKVKVVAENLQVLNKFMQVNVMESMIEDVPVSLIGEHDVAIACMNNFKSRTYLLEACKRFQRPYVEATCMGAEGFVQVRLPDDPQDESGDYFDLSFVDELDKSQYETNQAAGSIIAGIAGQEVIKIAFKIQGKNIGDVQAPRYIKYNGFTGLFETYVDRKDLLQLQGVNYSLDAALLKRATVFIAGVGALGCEIAKDLALAGVGKLILVDLDTIETSNLSRQLLFRLDDIGKPKAEVGAIRVKELNPDIEVEFHFTKIQELPIEMYEKCDVIIAALDNVQARFDLNVIARRVKRPMIEGGTVGFEGHVQVIVPEGVKQMEETACYRCVVPIPPPDNRLIAACTPKGIPQNREHCVLRAEWIFRKKKEREPDLEDKSDRVLLTGASNKELLMLKEREPGKDHGDPFVLQDMENILKNKIPAIQTVSSVIASIESMEALKMACIQISDEKPAGYTVMNPTYLNYNGIWGIIDHLPVLKREECVVCGTQKGIEFLQIPITPESMLGDIFLSLQQIGIKLDEKKTMITNPATKGIIYHALMPNSSSLDRKLSDVGIAPGQDILLTPFGMKREEGEPEPMKYQITLISVS
ncbi:MAG: ThiF family adenylyltransferase [Promethearchaeota archaeon]